MKNYKLIWGGKQNITIPKLYGGGSYGTTGFKLNYATSGDLGDDKSGQGNDWAEANIAASDQSKDTPTNNQITFNPLNNQQSGADSITEGLTVYNGPGTRTMISLTSHIPPTGKWAVAFSVSVVSTNAGWSFGITKGNDADFNDAAGSNEDVGANSGVNMGVSSSDLTGYDYITSTSIDPSQALTTSDEFWMAVDMANGKCHLGIYDDSADAMVWMATDGGVDLPDNGRINFGDANDLKIYHSGTHSIIQDTGTGDLQLKGSAITIRGTSTGENMGVFTENGAVDLYYNGNKKCFRFV